MKLPVLTNSQMRTFRRCPREHQFAYTLGYRQAAEPEALRFGSLVHHGLEAWFRAEDRATAIDAAMSAIAEHSADPFDTVKAGVMLHGYDVRWRNESMRVIAVEAEFRAPLVNPETGKPSRTFDLGGKLDAVVEHEGQIKLVEHKTTSEDIGPGSAYWKRLSIDPQVSTYFAGGKAIGHEITECIYDVLGKPGIRPKDVPLTDDAGTKIVLDANGTRVRTKAGKWRETADTAKGYVLQTRPESLDEFGQRLAEHIAANPDRYYQRGTVVRLEQEEADAAHDAWATARLIREAEIANRWPRNPDACVRYGRECGFFGVCTGTASLDDPSLYRRTDNVHEELTEAA